MIENISLWAKNLSLAIIIVSILEMLLPNNKTKKYIKVIMGIYILFSIIFPFIETSENFNINNLDIVEYSTQEIVETSEVIDQTSMDKRINEIYEEELEKDIIKKLDEKGYTLDNCKVDLDIKEKEVNIEKIKLKIKKKGILLEDEEKQIKEFLILEYGVNEKCLKIS